MPAVATAAGEWNDLLAPDHANPDPALRQGLGYAPFSFDTADPDCPADIPDTDTDYIRVLDHRTDCNASIATECEEEGTPATATTDKSRDPPRIQQNLMDIFLGNGNDSTRIQEERWGAFGPCGVGTGGPAVVGARVVCAPGVG